MMKTLAILALLLAGRHSFSKLEPNLTHNSEQEVISPDSRAQDQSRNSTSARHHPPQESTDPRVAVNSGSEPRVVEAATTAASDDPRVAKGARGQRRRRQGPTESYSDWMDRMYTSVCPNLTDPNPNDPVAICDVKVIVDHLLWRQLQYEGMEVDFFQDKLPTLMRQTDRVHSLSILNTRMFPGRASHVRIHVKSIEVHPEKYPGDQDDPHEYMVASRFYQMLQAYDWEGACMGFFLTYRMLQDNPAPPGKAHFEKWMPSMLELNVFFENYTGGACYMGKDTWPPLPYDVARSFLVPFRSYLSSVLPFSLLRPQMTLKDHFSSLQTALDHQVGHMFNMQDLRTPNYEDHNARGLAWPTSSGQYCSNLASYGYSSMEKKFSESEHPGGTWCLRECTPALKTQLGSPACKQDVTKVPVLGVSLDRRTATAAPPRKAPRPQCYPVYRSNSAQGLLLPWPPIWSPLFLLLRLVAALT